MATIVRSHTGTIKLGATAQQTIEDFVLGQLGSDAETALELPADSADASLISSCTLHWVDDGQGGFDCYLRVVFEKEGTWTPT